MNVYVRISVCMCACEYVCVRVNMYGARDRVNVCVSV